MMNEMVNLCLNLNIQILGKEIIKSKFGDIECLKFIPIVQSGRIFKEQESVTIWISNDKNRIPIRVQADVIVGSIKAELENLRSAEVSRKGRRSTILTGGTGLTTEAETYQKSLLGGY